MRKARTNVTLTSYLDVSQFIIKEHSPLIKPSSPQHHHPHHVTPFRHFVHDYLSNCLFCYYLTIQFLKYSCTYFLHLFKITQIHNTQETPQIAPIDHDPSQFYMTPLSASLISPEINDLLEDFILDSGVSNDIESKSECRKKKGKRYDYKSSLSLQMFRLDSQLQRIIEHDQQHSNYIEQNYSDSQSSLNLDEQDQGITISSSIYNHWAIKSKSKDCSLRDTQQQRQSTIDLSIVDYSQTIDRFAKNPKQDILKKLREIQSDRDETDQQEKKNMIKQYLEKYILQYEAFCFEEAWKELNQNISSTISTLVEGIEETFSKKIGFLAFESRRVKLLKYLEKKKKRIWRKKVSYDCRKKVADGRLRIKGKFVTREQACQQLGLQSLDNYSAEQIKQMLQRRIDESLNQQLVC